MLAKLKCVSMNVDGYFPYQTFVSLFGLWRDEDLKCSTRISSLYLSSFCLFTFTLLILSNNSSGHICKSTKYWVLSLVSKVGTPMSPRTDWYVIILFIPYSEHFTSDLIWFSRCFLLYFGMTLSVSIATLIFT